MTLRGKLNLTLIMSFCCVFTVLITGSPTVMADNNHIFYCDNDGNSGACMSLPANGIIFPGEGLFPVVNGAWTWNAVSRGTVSSGYPFSDEGLDDEFSGDNVWQFELYRDTSECAQNVGGQAYLENCVSGRASQLFVQDTNYGSINGWSVNVGRSDDEGHREVLCDTGGNNQLQIEEPGSCSNAGQDWVQVQA